MQYKPWMHHEFMRLLVSFLIICNSYLLLSQNQLNEATLTRQLSEPLDFSMLRAELKTSVEITLRLTVSPSGYVLFAALVPSMTNSCNPELNRMVRKIVKEHARFTSVQSKEDSRFQMRILIRVE